MVELGKQMNRPCLLIDEGGDQDLGLSTFQCYPNQPKFQRTDIEAQFLAFLDRAWGCLQGDDFFRLPGTEKLPDDLPFANRHPGAEIAAEHQNQVE